MGAIHQALLATGGSVPSGDPSSYEFILLAGADHEAATAEKWHSGSAVPIASGVSGAHGLVYNNITLRQAISIVARSELSGGCRVMFRSDTTDAFFRFQDTSSTNQLSLGYVAGGAFRVARGNTPVQLAISSSGIISLNTWYWAELTAVINNSGSFTARLYDDSQTMIAELTDSSVDTQETANASADRVDVGGISADTYTDDCWIDGSGELHGPVQVEVLYPSGAGDLAELTRGGADSGANWSQCDETTNNGDTDYVQSTGSNQNDSYVFQNRSLSGTLLGVQVVVCAKSTSGAPSIRAICRIGGVTYLGAIAHTLSTIYEAYWEVFDNNPATGFAWTDSEVNSAQFGVRCVSANARVSQVVAETLIQI